MKKRNPNRIYELRGRRKWSQPELAEKVGAHWVTISKLERGQMRLTHDWMIKIAEALGVEPAELISDSPLVRTLYMAGILGEKGTVERYDDNKDTTEEDSTVPYDVQIGAVEPDRTTWFFVNTDAYMPYIHSGDVVRFTSQTVKDLESCIGRLCLVDIEGKSKTKLVGIPARAARPEAIDLQIPGSPTVKNLIPEAIAVASMALFNPYFIRDDDGYPVP